MNTIKIGKRIREARKAQNIQQKRMAEILGVGDKYLSAVERGARKPSLDLIIRIANVLGIGTDDILCDCLDFYKQNDAAPRIEREKGLSPERFKRLELLVDFLIDHDYI